MLSTASPDDVPVSGTARRTALGLLLGLPWVANAQSGPPEPRLAGSAAGSADVSPVGSPVVVEGQSFQRRQRVAGQPLVLNGTGVRAVAWFKGYAAGLYLVSRAGLAAEAVEQAGPKRLQMRMLQEVPAAEFVKAVHKGIQRNVTSAELPGLADRLAQFEALIAAVGTVRRTDVVDLDLDPAKGTLFLLNGTLRGDPIPGDDFYAALLKSFVGERPYDTKLKAGLLGQAG